MFKIPAYKIYLYVLNLFVLLKSLYYSCQFVINSKDNIHLYHSRDMALLGANRQDSMLHDYYNVGKSPGC